MKKVKAPAALTFSFTLRLPPALKAEIERVSIESNRSMSAVAIEALTERLIPQVASK